MLFFYWLKKLRDIVFCGPVLYYYILYILTFGELLYIFLAATQPMTSREWVEVEFHCFILVKNFHHVSLHSRGNNIFTFYNNVRRVLYTRDSSFGVFKLIMWHADFPQFSEKGCKERAWWTFRGEESFSWKKNAVQTLGSGKKVFSVYLSAFNKEMQVYAV